MAAYPITSIHKEKKVYPAQLLRTYDPPKKLYIRGTFPIQQKMVAIVGSRKHSSYGEQITRELVRGLVQARLAIVSGLAYGIDSIAHQESLHQNGTTIAVLGSGIDDTSITPRRHLSLAQNILDAGGTLISELPPGTPAATYTFPRRNRIIAGLVDLIIVTEAREKSGALITAQYGLDHAIEVATIPHPVTSPTGKGCNRLLQQGAHLVTNISDVAHLLNIHELPVAQTLPLYMPTDQKEETLLSLLSHSPTHIDEIIRTSTIPSAEVASILSLLELKGIVKNTSPMTYIRLR